MCASSVWKNLTSEDPLRKKLSEGILAGSSFNNQVPFVEVRKAIPYKQCPVDYTNTSRSHKTQRRPSRVR